MLIELLATISILIILAAVAIVSFISSTAKAEDAAAKSMLSTAQISAETIAIDNNGSYASVTKESLHSYEPTLAITAIGEAYISAVTATPSSYKITVRATKTGDEFSVERNSSGELIQSCTLGPNSTNHERGCTTNTKTGESKQEEEERARREEAAKERAVHRR